ncbi:MAG: hydroxylase [Phenylobacterium sp.]|uniref:hydroxylase n=1 Tax=Phenylobacterium sp. TaxID=1871053 RepID=UPI00122A84CC|nr:hydroxylase [Phenylobacterium sp.]TAJ71773.1 MAG: hydroxylase [Phenylobacterium sp.]
MSRTGFIVAAFAVGSMLAGCATTAAEPSPEQLAACEKMIGMGEGATHEHAKDRTGMASSMGLTHAQCRSMLRR